MLLHRKRIYDDGAIAEIRLWWLAEPVAGSAHRFKYSLFYGTSGRRLVGYDNERGKGDHVHREGLEQNYAFVSLDQLLGDFAADVAALRGRDG